MLGKYKQYGSKMLNTAHLFLNNTRCLVEKLSPENALFGCYLSEYQDNCCLLGYWDI